MHRAHPTVDLTGTWRTDDYDCPWGVKHSQLVSVAHDGDRIVATKVTGDDCVPAGFETFSGRLPAEAHVGAITWTTGLPNAPASSVVAGYLKIVSNDEFRAGYATIELAFVRQPTAR